MKQDRLVIYCTRCPMWFDTKNGWKAKSCGVPTCPSCGAPLMQIDSEEFYKLNEDRIEEVMTWEWPNGSFWMKEV